MGAPSGGPAVPEDNRQDIFMLLTLADGRVAAHGAISRAGQLGWLELESFSLEGPPLGGFGGGGNQPPFRSVKGFTTVRALDKVTPEITLLAVRGVVSLKAVIHFVSS